MLSLRSRLALTALLGAGLLGPLTASAADGVEQWRFKVGNVSGSPAIASDGTIYSPSTIPPAFASNGIVAVNRDGSLAWAVDTSVAVSCIAVLPTSGILLTAGASLIALAASGQQVWRFDAPAALACPAIGADGSVYVGVPGAQLYALNPDGSAKWQNGDVCGGGSPSLDGTGNVYVYGCSNTVAALTPTGSLRWSQYVGAWEGVPISISRNGTIYAGGWNRLNAINPDGTPKWTAIVPGFAIGAALGPGEIVYTGTSVHDGNLYAINADGTPRWTYITSKPNTIGHPVVGDDGIVFAGTYFTGLHAINADGTPRWIFEPTLNFREPTMAIDGTLFAIGGEFLFAIGTAAAKPSSAGWPMLAHDGAKTSSALSGELTFGVPTAIPKNKRCDFGSKTCKLLGSFHTGIDYSGTGTAISVAAGTVIALESMSDTDHGMGNNAIVRHDLPDGSAIFSTYSHLASFDPAIANGARLTKGQTIGVVGCSGYNDKYYWCRNDRGKVVYSPHLHFEMKTATLPLADPPVTISGNPRGVGAQNSTCKADARNAAPSTCWGYVGNRLPPGDYGYVDPNTRLLSPAP